jgi:hypothetical protein
MRFHAIDSSGSAYPFFPKVWSFLQDTAEDNDFVVQFSTEVGKVKLWKDVKRLRVEDCLVAMRAGTFVMPLIEWTSMRALTVMDELVIYSDGFFGDLRTDGFAELDLFYKVRMVDVENLNVEA